MDANDATRADCERLSRFWSNLIYGSHRVITFAMTTNCARDDCVSIYRLCFHVLYTHITRWLLCITHDQALSPHASFIANPRPQNGLPSPSSMMMVVRTRRDFPQFTRMYVLLDFICQTRPLFPKNDPSLQPKRTVLQFSRKNLATPIITPVDGKRVISRSRLDKVVPESWIRGSSRIGRLGSRFTFPTTPTGPAAPA